jgi:hypothetical protein
MTTQQYKLDRDIIISTDSLFGSISYDDGTDSWTFKFTSSISLFASTLWRLLKDEKIILVSTDNGHQFGLPKPVDTVNEMANFLKGQKLSKIKIKQNTADLILTLTNGFEIEVFISSGGYESYDLYADNKRYIGMGMGDVAIFNNGQ